MTGSKFEIFWGRILPDPPTRLVPWALEIMLPPPPFPSHKNLVTALLPGTQAHNRLREAKIRINRKFDKTVKKQFLKWPKSVNINHKGLNVCTLRILGP